MRPEPMRLADQSGSAEAYGCDKTELSLRESSSRKPAIILMIFPHAIAYAESFGYGIVQDLVGHGIGTHLHEEPQMPNFRQKRKGIKLVPGMTLAIEPMINMGTWKVAGWMMTGRWSQKTIVCPLTMRTPSSSQRVSRRSYLCKGGVR